MSDTMIDLYGPRTEAARYMHAKKHRGPEESYDDYCVRFARAVTETPEQFYQTLELLRPQIILPAGRQQTSVGRPTQTTAFNCFVAGRIEDSIEGIFQSIKEGAKTMALGGGMGWDFSTLRPEGEVVRGLGGMGNASGPLQFMTVFDQMCRIIVRSWGRGAMMGVMRVDHPDILKFVYAKRKLNILEKFNISVAVTDEFMEALDNDGFYTLQFEGRSYGRVRARDVWGPIMESNWDWGEPGVIFIDEINRLNPLYYCEKIYATNPCGEQPLPPYGCCLLGSLNIAKMVVPQHTTVGLRVVGDPSYISAKYEIDYDLLERATTLSVQAYDNVIDRTCYPLPQQEAEEKAKRRMGIGVTGMADALAICGFEYGSETYIEAADKVLSLINTHAYAASSEIAERKGSFPLFDKDKYCEGEFFKTVLPEEVQYRIKKHGLRNSHLTSIAPTGTISLDADNCSSGIEPAIYIKQERDIIDTSSGDPTAKKHELINYAYNFYKVRGKTAEEVPPEVHIEVLCRSQKWVDSSVSKTCNVKGQRGPQADGNKEGEGTSFEQFEGLYLQAWEGGAKSCTTFNLNGKRMGILRSLDDQQPTDQPGEASSGGACMIDPETNIRSCES